jgi:hypothetical protein
MIKDLEKKDYLAELKHEMEPLKQSKADLLKNIKTKAEFVNENCYKFVDFDERMVGYYNSEGLLVECRPIRPDEMQRTINMATGTDN